MTSVLSMGEVTTLARNSPKFASLRTTIPMNIVRQWQLKEGSQLDWSWDIVKGEMVVVVRKHEANTFAPNLQEGRENRSREELDLEQQEAQGKKSR
jgi:bifunctional DNA-binding transcriptional regulator/antitoxin component of YhaV-PrlF toxin-antitoxin module